MIGYRSNVAMMNLHLIEISTAISSGAHAVLVMDGAGWHQTGDKPRVPDNITCGTCRPTAPN